MINKKGVTIRERQKIARKTSQTSHNKTKNNTDGFYSYPDSDFTVVTRGTYLYRFPLKITVMVKGELTETEFKALSIAFSKKIKETAATWLMMGGSDCNLCTWGKTQSQRTNLFFFFGQKSSNI